MLIHPNPESALNEDAGKLLIESYDEYAERAKIMTKIHAQPKNKKEETEKKLPKDTEPGSVKDIKKAAAIKKTAAKAVEKKKKGLKRL